MHCVKDLQLAHWMRLTQWHIKSFKTCASKQSVHCFTTVGIFLLLLKSQSNFTMIDPRYEDEALSALMEEAFSETTEETKFDVEAYIANSDFDW